MSYNMIMPCPVYVEETDDVCGEPIELSLTKEERATWTYPGCPAEFEVVHAVCSHEREVEAKYKDEVWEYVRDREIDALEARADAAREEALYRKYYERGENDY
jgi:hypothetical protein